MIGANHREGAHKGSLVRSPYMRTESSGVVSGVSKLSGFNSETWGPDENYSGSRAGFGRDVVKPYSEGFSGSVNEKGNTFKFC